MQKVDLSIDAINEILYNVFDDEESTMCLIEEYFIESQHYDWNVEVEWNP